MSVLWILDYGHPDHGGGTPRTPQDVAAFGRFVEAAAAISKATMFGMKCGMNQTRPSSGNHLECVRIRNSPAGSRRGHPQGRSGAKISSGGLSRFDAPFLSSGRGS